MFRYIFIILHLSSLSYAQNYLWPTDASKHLTSSFCEYRPGHYHSALDIKTWNKEGYKCFAVDDGYIERIKISPHGAGKALYIKLKDGRKAVYFHLQQFSPALEGKIREIQLAQKSYSIEWWPKNWSVKKGDFIAYTGQTGIGVPHLHFEIRDASNRPLNPLRFYNEVKDNIRPQLKRLLIIPQDGESRVNGSFKPARYDITYIHDGVYIIKDDIYASGRIGLALNGYDMADGVSNKFAWYQVKMTVNGQKIFEYAYDRVSFMQSRYVDVDIYYPEKKESGKSYNKLYLEPFNILDFYNRELGNGLINVFNEKVSFEIEVKDYFGNTSFLKGTLLPEKNELTVAPGNEKKEENAFISLKMPADLKNIALFSGNDKKDLQPIEYFEIMQRQQNNNDSEAFVKVRLANATHRLVQAVIEDISGYSDTSYVAVKVARRKVTTDFQLMGKNLYFSFANLDLSEHYSLSLIQGSDTSSYALKSKNEMAELIVPAKAISSDAFRLVLKDEHYIYKDTTITVFKMIPGQARNYSFYSDSIQIDAGFNNAFDTLFFKIETAKSGKDLFKIPVLSDVYVIDTGNHILNSSVDVSVKIDSTYFKPEQVAFYSVDDDGLDYEGGNYNSETGFVSDRQRSFSPFIVAADTIAPEIELINFKVNGSYKSVSAFRFKVTDDASGIGTDKNIEVYLDDQYLIPEWDPERDIVKSIVHYTPAKGAHVLKISCRDRAGNVTEKLIPVNIL